MSEESQKTLSASEVLTEAFTLLVKALGKEEIRFSPKARSEVGNDSDYHRTRIGYMWYESVWVVKPGEKLWAIGLGQAGSSYPARPFGKDIIAIPLSEGWTAETIRSGIEFASYFDHSLIFSTDDGNFSFHQKGIFGTRIVSELEKKIDEFFAECSKFDPGLVTLDLRPVVTSAAKYRPGFSGFMAKVLIENLSK